MSNLVPIEGVKVNIGDSTYIVPPLSFKALRLLKGKLRLLTDIGNIPEDEQLDAVLDVVLMALNRNYPMMTREDLEDIIDLANLRVLITAIMGVSGLEQTRGEAESPEMTNP